MFAWSPTTGETLVIIWFAIVIVAAVIEALSMDLTSIWFSAGAFLALIVEAIFGDTPGSIIAQIVVFFAVSITMLLLIRPVLQRNLKKNEVLTNADRLIGKTAFCLKKIVPDERGEVKIDGKIWTAISNEIIEINEKVEVLAIDGVKLVVRKAS